MKKGTLSREQAVKLSGLAAVEAVDKENCEPTNRVGYNGSLQRDEETECSASVTCPAGTLTVYYYTTVEQDDEMAEHDGDGSCINWEIAGYEITD